MGFRSVPKEIETSDTEVFEMPATLAGAVVLAIGNVSGSARTYTLDFYKQAEDETTRLADDVSIAANTIIKFPAPLAMQAGDKIIMSASAADSINAFATVTDSLATPAATGFTPKGTYNGATTFALNDIVELNGTSYISMQASNLNHSPDSSPAWWMVLAEKGETGTGDVDGPASSVDGRPALFDGTTGKQLKQHGEALGTAAGAALGTSGNTVPKNNTANLWDAPQSVDFGTIADSTAWGGTTKMAWDIPVNGSDFDLVNPSALRPNTLYLFRITFASAHTANLGTVFKGVGLADYTPSAASGKIDFLWMLSNDDADELHFVGFENDVGA